MPHHSTVARTLQQRYRLRWHGLLIGSFTLLLMWCSAHVQMLLGVDSLALRYLVTLSVGYLGYLLVLRAWAARLVRQRKSGEHGADGGGGDALDLATELPWPRGGCSDGGGTLPRTGGGDFGGGGASGDFDGAGPPGLSDAGLGSSEPAPAISAAPMRKIATTGTTTTAPSSALPWAWSAKAGSQPPCA